MWRAIATATAHLTTQALACLPLIVQDAAQDAAQDDPRPMLRVDAPAPTDSLGLALWDARIGRANDAVARVEGLLADVEPDTRPRFERAHARLLAWRDLRDIYLGDLAAGGGKLTLMNGEKRVKVTVEKLEGGELHLAKNKAGWDTYPVNAIPAGTLAQAMGKSVDGLAPAWVRLYGYALDENDKWSKLLKDDDEESRAMRADIEADFAKLLRSGRCLAELRDMATMPDPVGLEAGDALVARIDALRLAGMGMTVVEERAKALRDLEAIAHGARFDALGPAAALKGELKDLGDGRFELTYSFDKPEELEDFARDDGYMKSFRKRLPPVSSEAEDDVWVRDGSMRLQGEISRRLVLPFAAPLQVAYDFSIDPPKSGELSFFDIRLGIGDNRDYRFAWCSNLGDIEVWNERDDARRANAERDRGYELGRTYSMRVEHDGKRFRALNSDEEVTSLEHESEVSGSIFLWIHTGMRINVRKIRVEGRIDPSGLDALRTAWVQAQLDA